MKATPVLLVQTVLFAGLSFASCSDDDTSERLSPTLPTNGGSPVASIAHLGSIPDCYDWELTYSNGRLVEATGTLRATESEDDRSYSYTSSLAYSTTAVRVTNSGGESVSLTLGNNGYIATMTADNSTYEFSYSSGGLLTSWEKTVKETSFGQATTYTASGTLSYSGSALSRIRYYENGSLVRTLELTSAQITNTSGVLPELTAKEMGILGFEYLYYAGLLGTTPNYLPATLTVIEADSTTTDYAFTYTLNADGNPALCTYTYNNAATTAVYSY